MLIRISINKIELGINIEARQNKKIGRSQSWFLEDGVYSRRNMGLCCQIMAFFPSYLL